MAAPSAGGLVDLEKELTCSICTDVLYQPLTLLDCLHTFCGACLKEWFAFQRAQHSPSSHSSTHNPYTCPSCRATVRGTKHNATVNTLLDMFLQANPERAKSEEEKEGMRERYTHGEDVVPMPRVRRRVGSRGAEENDEDRRVLEEVRELSLREVGVSDGASDTALLGAHDRDRDRRRRERSRDQRSREDRSRRHRDIESEELTQRQLEHQSSLRSLLSVSEIDSREIQEEIMRQIMDEGLLDGIDLNNIDVSQEDEISERIAAAYRRRLEERRRERHRMRAEREREREREREVQTTAAAEAMRMQPPSSGAEGERASSRRRRERPEPVVTNTGQTSRPPVSRPHLFETANQSGHSHRRAASQDTSGRASSRRRTSSGLAATSASTAARSATDLSNQATSLEAPNPERRRRLSHNDRRVTDPERQSGRDIARALARTADPAGSNPNSPRRAAFAVSDSPQPRSPAIGTLPDPTSAPASRRNTDIVSSTNSRPSNITSSPRIGSHADSSVALSTPRSQPSPPPRPQMFAEPNITCNRCERPHLEYTLHYNCPRCASGKYELCKRCYLSAFGCLHWFGFGHSANRQFDIKAPPGGWPPNTPPPHVLTGHRYKRLSSEPTRVAAISAGGSEGENRTIMTNEDPAKRLRAGVFCAVCENFANACFWKCDTCNDGEWGYCNSCVNQGKHCTHPLLPLTHVSTKNPSKQGYVSPDSPSEHRLEDAATSPTSPIFRTLSPLSHLTPKSASIIRTATTHTRLANTLFRPLTFTVHCDICTYPIPPSNTRFHCPRCNEGDYDICSTCYHGLVNTGRIKSEDGTKGWRRCLKGHRMVIVGFEDRGGGQVRVVQRDLVGGLRAQADEDEAAAKSNSGAANAVGTDAGNDGRGTEQTREAKKSDFTKVTWTERDGTKAEISSARAATSQLPATSKFPPPDGGEGGRWVARWPWWPEDGDVHVLALPKWAEVTEVDDINGDWFSGSYCGRIGFFPGPYGEMS